MSAITPGFSFDIGVRCCKNGSGNIAAGGTGMSAKYVKTEHTFASALQYVSFDSGVKTTGEKCQFSTDNISNSAWGSWNSTVRPISRTCRFLICYKK